MALKWESQSYSPYAGRMQSECIKRQTRDPKDRLQRIFVRALSEEDVRKFDHDLNEERKSGFFMAARVESEHELDCHSIREFVRTSKLIHRNLCSIRI